MIMLRTIFQEPNLNDNPEKIVIEKTQYVSFQYDNCTLVDLQSQVGALIFKYGPDAVLQEDFNQDGSFVLAVKYKELETDGQYAARMFDFKKRAKEQENEKNKRLKQFMELKKEFEPD
jgi:hypothetical protein